MGTNQGRALMSLPSIDGKFEDYVGQWVNLIPW